VSGLDTHARRSLYALLKRIAARAQLVVTAHSVADLPEGVTPVPEIDRGRILSCAPVAHRPAGSAKTRGAATTGARAAATGAKPAIGAAAASPSDRAPPVATASERAPAARAGNVLIEVDRADVWLGDRHVLR